MIHTCKLYRTQIFPWKVVAQIRFHYLPCFKLVLFHISYSVLGASLWSFNAWYTDEAKTIMIITKVAMVEGWTLSVLRASKTAPGSAKGVSSSSGEAKQFKGAKMSKISSPGQQNLDDSFAQAGGNEFWSNHRQQITCILRTSRVHGGNGCKRTVGQLASHRHKLMQLIKRDSNPLLIWDNLN